MTDDAPTRCGFAAVIGAPNAGKSTLVNRLVGAKVSIVTHKVQTTRFRIRGVAIRGRDQVVLIDTPGVFAPKRRLERAMVRAAWGGANDADVIVALVDAEAEANEDGSAAARRSVADARRALEGLAQADRPLLLALNKIDRTPRDRLLPLAEELGGLASFEASFMISAETGDGVEDLFAAIAARLPEGPWLYPEDQIGDLSERLLAAEITREKLLLRLHDELPYETTVETEAWREQKDGSVRIEQTIYVARDSQKPIVLGQKGRTIRTIGETARRDLEAQLQTRVHLFLFVKVRGRWQEDPARYRALGLDPAD